MASAERQKSGGLSCIEEGLYLGGSVDEPPSGTRAVLNLCEREDPYHCEVHRWDYIPDGPAAPSISWLRDEVDFVDAQRRAGLPTYVHCYAGVSRGCLVTTAYLMSKNHWTRDDALAFIRSKRGKIGPNEAFLNLLLEWEGEVRGKGK